MNLIDIAFKNLQSILTVVGFIILYLLGVQLFASIGICIFIYFLFQFIINLGMKIEVRDVIILIATAQWIIGAVLSYIYVPLWFRYAMVIPESQYMGYVVPAVLLFVFGLYFPLYRSKVDYALARIWIKQQLAAHPNLDLVIFGMGIFSSFASSYAPYSLRFVFYLLAMLKYIGVFYILFSKRKHKNIITGIVLLVLFLECARQAMFHEFLLWGIFIFIVFSFANRINYKQKIVIFTILLFGVFSIQLIKNQLRAVIWNARQKVTSTDAASAFKNALFNKYSKNSKLMNELEKYITISRLNQGWIIAQVMEHVPDKEPFANGETINRAIEDSIFPRFLKKNKMKAGGQENYMRFTGRIIRKGTSMDLGIVGEAYANYGVRGGIIFMFILGIFYNIVLSVINKISEKNPIILLWIPFLFFFVIKAESGFYLAFNHIIKASMLLVVVFLFLNAIYKMNFHPFDDWRNKNSNHE